MLQLNLRCSFHFERKRSPNTGALVIALIGGRKALAKPLIAKHSRCAPLEAMLAMVEMVFRTAHGHARWAYLLHDPGYR